MKDFVFRGEWLEAIGELPDAVRTEICMAIIGYGCMDIEPVLKQTARVAFGFAKATIDNDRQQAAAASDYLTELRRKQSEGGKAAMAKRWARKHKKGSPLSEAINEQNDKGLQEETVSENDKSLISTYISTNKSLISTYKQAENEQIADNSIKTPVLEKEKEEKENFPPTPPLKEKEEKEKESIQKKETLLYNKLYNSAKKKKPFQIPTLEEVRQYCAERNNGVDAEGFVDFYTANGWVQGRQGKPLKDWKAAVRTWERMNYGETKRELKAQYGPRVGTYTQPSREFLDSLNERMKAK